jgi:hypothetical protein
MLRTGQGVVLVHVEVRCYVTYWAGDGVSACGGAMLCYVLDRRQVHTLQIRCSSDFEIQKMKH